MIGVSLIVGFSFVVNADPELLNVVASTVRYVRLCGRLYATRRPPARRNTHCIG